jgi:hypothetical protein
VARRIEALRAQWAPAVRQRFAEINAAGTDDLTLGQATSLNRGTPSSRGTRAPLAAKLIA